MTGPQLRSIATNILPRHLLQEHEDRSPRASALLLRVRTGQERIFCPATVIFEAIHILHGRIDLPRADVAWALTDLIRLPNFVMAEEDVVLDAVEVWRSQPPLDYADCYHLALTKALGITGIYTFDRKMDRFPGVKRVEP